jgi:N-methylhydantoinase A
MIGRRGRQARPVPQTARRLAHGDRIVQCCLSGAAAGARAMSRTEALADTVQRDLWRVGVDIGGTFTDLVAVSEATGEVRVTKVPTVPADPSEGFLDALTRALAQFAIAPAAITFAVHGTTVATNTIIQGKGARCGLIASDGFSDVLEIAYQTRPSLYDILYEKPKPLIPRHLTRGVRERTGPEGEQIVPLDEAELAQAARELVAMGVEAIAVAFLHSYRAPGNERRAAVVIRDVAPDLPVILSSDICPEFREYPRTSTTVVNAVLLPRVGPYIARLEQRLAELGLHAGLHLMTSSGGIMAAATARAAPVHLVESGPAAGVIGAAFVAQDLETPDLADHILALDIGGTTAKVALVDHGRPALADEFEVGAAAVATITAARGQGYPVKTPVISLVEIGAGGGSIASIDPGGALAVGPESAGADPGPACYGRGGERPTLTDCNLLLGRLNPDYFLGGALSVDIGRARAAVERDLARPLRLGIEAAARAAIDIADARMVAALRFVSIQRGIDPRDYVLVPSGGAGPVHAAAIAAALGVRRVLIPPAPGLNSALGLLATDIKHELVRSWLRPTREADADAFRAGLDDLAAAGATHLAAENVAQAAQELIRECELCYVGQGFALRVQVPETEDVLGAVDAAFRAAHRQLYGFASDTEPTMVVNLRVTALGRVERPRLTRLPPGDGQSQAAVKGRRTVWFDQPLDCPILERAALRAGDVVAGPAIIEQMDTTTVLPPGSRSLVDAGGSLIVTLAA